MSKHPTILGIGELLWDLLPSGRKMGGAVANLVYFAQAFGARARLVTRVGDDDDGRAIRARLAEAGLALDLVQTDRDHPTGTVDVTVDGRGQPAYTIHTEVAWDFIAAEPALLAAAAGADAVCFGSLAQRAPVSRAAVRRVVEAAPAHCLRVCDINLRQHYFDEMTIRWCLDTADVLKLNNDEVPVVGRLLGVEGDERTVVRSLVDRFGLRLAAVTRGGLGSLLCTPDEWFEHPGVPAAVKDTVGAGDAFAAVLTAGLLKGLTPDTINAHANRVAAYVCSQDGATPGGLDAFQLPD